MDNFNDENSQEVITNDSQVIDEMMNNLKKNSKRSLAEQSIVGDYYVKGEPVKGHYKTDDERYIIVEKKIIADNLELHKRFEQMSASFGSLQKQIIENGKAMSDMNRVSSMQEAIEKYGDEIFAYLVKEHREKIIEQMRPEIEKAVIREYLATHKRPVYLENANKKRSENCAGRTAAYLADFYNGLGTLEIAEKHGAVRGTIQRLLRINDSSDIDRLMEAYSNNSELFDGATEEEVRGFLEARWNKKSESLEKRLAAAQRLIAKNASEDNGDEWGKNYEE